MALHISRIILHLLHFCNVEITKMGEINHIGTVIKVTDNNIQIAVTTLSACATCREKSACAISESKQKIIDVEIPDFPVCIGDKVLVTTSLSNAGYSVILAYVLPVFILLCCLVIVTWLGMSELFAACGSLFCLFLYYLALFLLKDRIKRKIRFTIKQINKD